MRFGCLALLIDLIESFRSFTPGVLESNTLPIPVSRI